MCLGRRILSLEWPFPQHSCQRQQHYRHRSDRLHTEIPLDTSLLLSLEFIIIFLIFKLVWTSTAVGLGYKFNQHKLLSAPLSYHSQRWNICNDVCSTYKSSQMNLHFMFPLLPETRSPSHNFSVVKTFQKGDPPDFKFYLGKWNNGVMLTLSVFTATKCTLSQRATIAHLWPNMPAIKGM